jgi:phosphopantetheinyl transferase
MIIFQKQLSPVISIAVWQIDEIEDFFWNDLQLLAEDKAKIKNIKLQQVRLQKLACRATLAELLGNHLVEITYSVYGAPLLENYHLSFSHTKNFAAVALATIPVGIDMEELAPRILPLYTRFMSEHEIATSDVINIKNLYYYWCAKEAMYKWYGKKNLDFIEDLKVDKSNKQGIICNKHIVKLTEFLIDNQLIVVSF